MWWEKLIKKIKNSAIPYKYWWWEKDLNFQVSGFESGAISSPVIAPYYFFTIRQSSTALLKSGLKTRESFLLIIQGTREYAIVNWWVACLEFRLSENSFLPIVFFIRDIIESYPRFLQIYSFNLSVAWIICGSVSIIIAL